MYKLTTFFEIKGGIMGDQKRKLSKDGSVHVTDEKFNTMSHMLGLMISLLGVAILIVSASIQKAPWKIVSFSLYGFSLLSHKNLKKFFEIIEI